MVPALVPVGSVLLTNFVGEAIRPHGEAKVESIDEEARRHPPTDGFGGYLDEIRDLENGSVEIRKIDGDPPRYVVLLKGIDKFEDADTANATDLNSVIRERLGG